MRDTLDDTLRAIFSLEAVLSAQVKRAISGLPVGPLSDMAQKALDHYNKAMDYLKQANGGKYGEALNKLKEILQQMTHKK